MFRYSITHRLLPATAALYGVPCQLGSRTRTGEARWTWPVGYRRGHRQASHHGAAARRGQTPRAQYLGVFTSKFALIIYSVLSGGI